MQTTPRRICVYNTVFLSTISDMTRFRFNGSNNRWSKTPAPSAGSACQVYGPVIGTADFERDKLFIDIANIALNIGPTQTVSSVTGSPSKRKRFLTSTSEATSAPSSSAVPSDPQSVFIPLVLFSF